MEENKSNDIAKLSKSLSKGLAIVSPIKKDTKEEEKHEATLVGCFFEMMINKFIDGFYRYDTRSRSRITRKQSNIKKTQIH
jgi:hypothetical protein